MSPIGPGIAAAIFLLSFAAVVAAAPRPRVSPAAQYDVIRITPVSPDNPNADIQLHPSVNNKGRVAGVSVPAAGNPRAFLTGLDGANPVDLGAIPGGNYSVGLGVNDSAHVTGYGDLPGGGDAPGRRGPRFPSGGSDHAFIFTNAMKALPTLDQGTQAMGWSINRNDQIAGSADNGGEVRACLFTPASGGAFDITDLGSLDGGESQGFGINGNGDVSGESEQDTGDIVHHAFREKFGANMEDLGVLNGGANSAGEAINDHEQVAGFSEVSTQNGITRHPFRYTDSQNPPMEDLGLLTGAASGVAFGINNLGDVVGQQISGSGGGSRAFRFRDGTGLQDLNNLIPAGTGWVLQVATSISDTDYITGVGTLNGVQTLFLLKPKNPRDTTSPVITKAELNPTTLPATGGNVTLTVTVTDVLPITTLTATVTLPDGSKQVIDLLNAGNTLIGSPNTTNQDQVYSVLVTAVDDAGNSASKSAGTFTVQAANNGSTLAISAASITPHVLPSSGGKVTVDATVTSNFAIESVQAIVDGDTAHPVTLSSNGGDNFEGTFTAPANTTTQPVDHFVLVQATDEVGTVVQKDAGDVTVAASSPDTQPPSILKCAFSPKSLPQAGGTVQFTATVTDNVGVASVDVQLNHNSDSQVALHSTDGKHFTGSTDLDANPGTAAESLLVTFQAFDAAGNEKDKDCGTLTVAGSGPPAQAHIVVEPGDIDYGRVELKCGWTKSFRIKNIGNDELTGTVGSVDEPFRVVSVGGSPVSAENPGTFELDVNQSVVVKVKFSPIKSGGAHTLLEIDSNDPKRPAVKVKLHGAGCPPGS